MANDARRKSDSNRAQNNHGLMVDAMRRILPEDLSDVVLDELDNDLADFIRAWIR